MRVARLHVLAGLGLGAVVLAPAPAAFIGARGPLGITLNLGPGDSPYISGFVPRYEIEAKVASHWATHDSLVLLPLRVETPSLELSCRFVRHFQDLGYAQFRLADGLARFEVARGFQERSAVLPLKGQTPLRVAIHVEARDERNLGLRLDWIRFFVPAGGRVFLLGAARFKSALSILLAALLLLGAGFRPGTAALMLLPLSAAASWALLQDPWLVHRLLTLVPEALAGFGLLGLGVGRWQLRRGRLSPGELRALAGLGLVTFLLRALPLNHPDFYYPDLQLHARLVELLRRAGVDFLASPYAYLWTPASAGRAASGLWLKPVGAEFFGMPYSLALHALLAPFPLTEDATIAALKTAGALASAVPPLLLFALARRLEVSALGALLLLFAPPYLGMLSHALVPALFGHVFDLAFVLWLAGWLGRPGAEARGALRPAPLLAGASLLTAAYLAYVSALVSLSLLVVVAAALAATQPGARSARAPLVLVTLGMLAALLALGVYYRDFVGPALRALRAATAAAASPAGPQDAWSAWRNAARWGYSTWLGLALSGLWILLRARRPRLLIGSWLLTVLALQLMRMLAPSLFFVHDVLFATPLLCLAAGAALAALWKRGRPASLAAAALGALLAVHGLVLQWSAWSAELTNAL